MACTKTIASAHKWLYSKQLLIMVTISDSLIISDNLSHHLVFNWHNGEKYQWWWNEIAKSIKYFPSIAASTKHEKYLNQLRMTLNHWKVFWLWDVKWNKERGEMCSTTHALTFFYFIFVIMWKNFHFSFIFREIINDSAVCSQCKCGRRLENVEEGERIKDWD